MTAATTLVLLVACTRGQTDPVVATEPVVGPIATTAAEPVDLPPLSVEVAGCPPADPDDVEAIQRVIDDGLVVLLAHAMTAPDGRTAMAGSVYDVATGDRISSADVWLVDDDHQVWSLSGNQTFFNGPDARDLSAGLNAGTEPFAGLRDRCAAHALLAHRGQPDPAAVAAGEHVGDCLPVAVVRTLNTLISDVEQTPEFVRDQPAGVELVAIGAAPYGDGEREGLLLHVVGIDRVHGTVAAEGIVLAVQGVEPTAVTQTAQRVTTLPPAQMPDALLIDAIAVGTRC